MMRASPVLGPTVEQAMGDEVTVTRPGGVSPASGASNGVLFSGTDVLSHVDIVSGKDGPGVWLPDYVAELLDAGPGDQTNSIWMVRPSPYRSMACTARCTRNRALGIGEPGASSSMSSVLIAPRRLSRSSSIARS